MHNKELVRLCIGGSNINSVLEILLTTKSAMVSDQGQFWMSVCCTTNKTKRRTDTHVRAPAGGKKGETSSRNNRIRLVNRSVLEEDTITATYCAHDTKFVEIHG